MFNNFTITGLRTVFKPSSNKKFPNARVTKSEAPVSGLPSVVASETTSSMKKMKQPSMNTPGFTSGQMSDATLAAMVVFHFFKYLYTIPEMNPHKIPFARTVMKVPGMSTAKNNAAPPLARTTMANINPSQA